MTRRTLSAICTLGALFFFLLPRTVATQATTVDWEKQHPEILRHYRSLIQIDSSNPPGNETLVVNYLKKIFDAEGIPAKVLAQDPARANIVARIKGNGRKRPLLLLAHTDVVGVQRDKWPVDPFGAVMKDGYVWGRGSTDDKDLLAANFMVMLLAKRSGVTFDRDLIFLAESGEEGTTGPGIEFIVGEHFDEIDAEFALTEGGGGVIENGRVTTMEVATTEKVPRRVRLVATGGSGHASIPRQDNAIVHLAAAVAKVGAWQTPVRLNETTRTYFERLAKISTPEKAAFFRAPTTPASEEYFAKRAPQYYTLTRTSVVPTILQGGFRMNVIPSSAEATVDIRALPDEDMPAFFAEMARVIDDPAVKIEPITDHLRPAGPSSRLDTDMFRALERASTDMYNGVAVLPTMLAGATDMSYLRPRGIQAYGIGSSGTNEDLLNYGAHSDVERLKESSLYDLVAFVWRAMTGVAAQ